ncbi:MAG TPA: glycosyltransferase family 39 protein [Ilumatobacteraceae bacterium]|nr:glycosyltransferase family 39 protein [Ilumatobacteraceae bacterium]
MRSLVVVGALVRVTYLLTKWNVPLSLNDSIYYSGQAQQLAHGRFFRELFVDRPGAEHGPLTSLLMAPVSFGDDFLRWQRCVTVVCGIALVWMLGMLGARLGGSRVGVVAAGIAAIAPNLWVNDGLVMSESVSMLLVACVLWCALDAVECATRRSFVLLGVALGLAALARSELALLAPLVLIWVALCRRRSGVSVWAAVIPVAASAAVVLLPWLAFNMTRFENPVLLTTNDGTTWLGANCDDTYSGEVLGGWSLRCVIADPDYRYDEEPSVRSSRQRAIAVSYIRHHLTEVPEVVLARVGRTLDLHGLSDLVHQDVGEERPEWVAWAGIVTFWMMAVASVVGALRLGRRYRSLLLAPFVVVLCTTVLFYGGHRIRSSAEPSLVLLTAVAVTAAVEGVRRRDRRSLSDASHGGGS